MSEKIQLSKLGEVVQKTWQDLPNHYKHIILDEFFIMPDHFHGIVFIHNTETQSTPNTTVGVVHEPPLQRGQQRRRMLIPKIMGRFKMVSGKQINLLQQTTGKPVWQRGYHDHIIRNEQDLNEIRHYIQTNPLRWALKHDNDS